MLLDVRFLAGFFFGLAVVWYMRKIIATVARSLWSWLKGSRMNFFVSSTGDLVSCSSGSGTSAHPVVEISRGPFRRRNAFYGKNSDNWKVAVGHWYVNSIELQDRRGLPVKTALELVKRYPSLQAMLDQIAELEKELASANKRRQEWGAAIKAVLQVIQLDRPRYRSKAAWHIRKCLESIEGSAVFHKEPEPTEEMISRLKNLFTNADLRG